MTEGVSLNVNGARVTLRPRPGETLLDALRDALGLRAARFGCGEGACGACTVLADDRPITACLVPLSGCDGMTITTLEGIGTPEAPHPLQAAFIAEQAMQCGYCASGILMRATALLAHNPNPTETDIRAALDDHLCRCGAQNRMIRAILRAADTMRGARV